MNKCESVKQILKKYGYEVEFSELLGASINFSTRPRYVRLIGEYSYNTGDIEFGLGMTGTTIGYDDVLLYQKELNEAVKILEELKNNDLLNVNVNE